MGVGRWGLVRLRGFWGRSGLIPCLGKALGWREERRYIKKRYPREREKGHQEERGKRDKEMVGVDIGDSKKEVRRERLTREHTQHVSEQ